MALGRDSPKAPAARRALHHPALLGILARAGGTWSLESDCRSLFLPVTALTAARSLRLLGGDGQEVSAAGSTVPHLVRVAVDTPGGPTAGATVTAKGSDGALVAAAEDGSAVPATLAGSGATADATATTDGTGVAAFVWQPSFGGVSAGAPASDVLTILPVGSDEAPIQVTAQLAASGGATLTPGVHVTGVTFSDGKPLTNDRDVSSTNSPAGSTSPRPAGQPFSVLRRTRWAAAHRNPVARPTPPTLNLAPPPSVRDAHGRSLGTLDADGTMILWRPGAPPDRP